MWYTHLYNCWSSIIPLSGTPVKLKFHWLGHHVFQAPKPYLPVTEYLPWVNNKFSHLHAKISCTTRWRPETKNTKGVKQSASLYEGRHSPSCPKLQNFCRFKKLLRGSLPLVPPLPSEAREISSASLFSIFSAPFFLLRVRPRFRSVPSSSAVFTKV